MGYSYTYPSNWSFRREGVGLYPLGDPNYPDNQIEILTIFSDKSDLTSKEWSMNYDGSGYAVERELMINGYNVYYVENMNDNYYTVLYTFSNDGLIIHVVFRKWLTTGSTYIDNSEYEQVVEDIVKSIKFLD